MRIILVLFACTVSQSVFAQSPIERIKQLSVENVCFEFPNAIHFSIDVLDEMTREGTASTQRRRFVGRQVSRQNQMRLDYAYIVETGKGEVRRFEHYLTLSPKEKFGKISILGGAPQDIDMSTGINSSLARVNPFHYVFGGSAEISRHSGSPIENAFSSYVDFDGSEDAIRTRGNRTGYFRLFEFDKEVPWKIHGQRTFEGPENGLWSDWKDSKQIVKKWALYSDIRVKWIEIASIGILPHYVYSERMNFDSDSPSDSETMEALFFGYEFENPDVDRYFDKSRWTLDGLKQDFKVEEVEELARKARQELDKQK